MTKTIEINLVEVMISLHRNGELFKKNETLEKTFNRKFPNLLKVEIKRFPIDYKEAMKQAVEEIDNYVKANPNCNLSPELVKSAYERLKNSGVIYY
ncbi:hypothetical protein GW922_02075 [Candidatus Pacearchaeota archaeon]|nr:hypothetical protein [Candidatus Pacearchaeota archaeon]PIN71465.1 MAG: hypothetical protein COV77_01715 [Candidatus Pacearchaeota archaeon CG11_big_fil_rev_8_21_14_0_20_30_13]PJA71089.1 MAG: hypothetical protein CO153_03335 [Candidatus Pacearchaeota archaeon CG_4_9_14_3_um_filter_30_11]